MRWVKYGLIFTPSRDVSWMQSHAALPVASAIDGDWFALYFSTRDAQGRARIGRCDLDITDPLKNPRLYTEPVIDLGPLGSFDDSGVTSACIVNHHGIVHQYYSGWSLGVTVPFYFYIGLATSDDGGRTFRKVSSAPVLERSADDPYLTASPCVLLEDGKWRMWYVSGVKWDHDQGRPKHYYHIKYTESADGINWREPRIVSIDFRSPDEYAIARPCVIKDDDIYQMWYCYRGPAYRIGYAESLDGLKWERKDECAGIELSASGWDSEMLCYPHVFRHRGTMYLLYNGNAYGKAGIGLAILE
jgi:hypothetical protein